MKQPVVRKQANSRKCVICGLSNPLSVGAEFYELANGELAGVFTAREEHQSYPGRLHGGIITALLDETIGRAILVGRDTATWGVTVEFRTRFLKPVPLDVPLRAVGRIVNEEERTFEGTGEILLPNGDVAATGSGKYVKLPIERITDLDIDGQMRRAESHDDPIEIEVGDGAFEPTPSR